VPAASTCKFVCVVVTFPVTVITFADNVPDVFRFAETLANPVIVVFPAAKVLDTDKALVPVKSV